MFFFDAGSVDSDDGDDDSGLNPEVNPDVNPNVDASDSLHVNSEAIVISADEQKQIDIAEANERFNPMGDPRLTLIIKNCPIPKLVKI